MIYGAWQTERFAREERLMPFSHYVKAAKNTGATPTGAAPVSRAQAMLAGLLAHQQAGAPISVRRINSKRPTSPA